MNEAYCITWVGYSHPTFDELGSMNGGGIYCAAPHGGKLAVYTGSRIDGLSYQICDKCCNWPLLWRNMVSTFRIYHKDQYGFVFTVLW